MGRDVSDKTELLAHRKKSKIKHGIKRGISRPVLSNFFKKFGPRQKVAEGVKRN
jgi:hypothetical protein